MKTTKKQSGFTLVELAIVLVIIGLIVGGVLAGSDLIKAATTQKAVKQINDINTAANTFRTKYNDLPGDLKNPHLVFTAATITGSSSSVRGHGDGNGFVDAPVDNTGALTVSVGISGEVAVFFYEMAQAGYIKETIRANATQVDVNEYDMAQTDFPGAFQPTALGKNSYFVVSSGPSSTTTNDGKNYIFMVGTTTENASAGLADFSSALLPVDAANIDSKLDDGVADAGTVKSVARLAPTAVADGEAAAPGSPSSFDCYDSGSKAYFSSFTTQTCNLAIRASF